MTFALVADAVSVGRKHAQPTESIFCLRFQTLQSQKSSIRQSASCVAKKQNLHLLRTAEVPTLLAHRDKSGTVHCTLYCTGLTHRNRTKSGSGVPQDPHPKFLLYDVLYELTHRNRTRSGIHVLLVL